MSDIVSRALPRARSAPARSEDRVHMFAVYGAFALIAAIVFGTLSVRPF
ncbi:MAG: hypothetical protein V4661_00010 [Pseudomonadota bacterium]|jgi:hypothetical protein